VRQVHDDADLLDVHCSLRVARGQMYKG
jgi:hypothetical protein